MTKGLPRSRFARYGFAIGVTVLALLIRLPLSSQLGPRAPYITFFIAVTASAAYGGFGPGVLSTLLGGVMTLFFILPPAGLFTVANFDEHWGSWLRFVGISGFISYLTGRLSEAKRYESALRHYFQQTLLSIRDAVISTGADKRIIVMNTIAEELTGWSLVEAKGKPVEEVFRVVQEGSNPPVAVPMEDRQLSSASSGPLNHRELITKSGARLPIEEEGAPIKDEQGNAAGTVLVFRDITQRREAERRLEESERRSRTILESIMDSFGLLDNNWRIAYVNPAAEKTMRRSSQELLGKNFWDEYPSLLGTIVEISFRNAVADRKPVFFEDYYEPWNRWFDTAAYPSDNGLSVYFRDITERKRSDQSLRRLNEDLTQFTYAATHDLREPVRMMTVNAQMLQRKLEPQIGEEGRRYVSNIVAGGKRVSKLIDGLLEFSRVGEIADDSPFPAAAETALSEALLDLQIVIGETHASIFFTPLPKLQVDRSHIRQLFQNLIGNAIKYRRPGVRPEIHISSTRELSEWLFAVQDNGIGIEPEHFEQIFIPFKRLHGPEIAGTGIGLATCKRIVEVYSGRIWVESRPERGSVFYFSLPAAEEGIHEA